MSETAKAIIGGILLIMFLGFSFKFCVDEAKRNVKAWNAKEKEFMDSCLKEKKLYECKVLMKDAL